MPLVHLQTKRLEYKFELTQKYNLLIGPSGSGKTKLVDLIYAFSRDRNSVLCMGYDKIITGRNISIDDLKTLNDYVIVLDEDSSILHRADVASLLEKSHNYFLIICRDITLGFKSVSLDCVFEIKSSGKYHTFKKAYNVPQDIFDVTDIVCEDSNSGFQFINSLFKNTNVSVEFAKSDSADKTGGKSKIASYYR